MDSFWSGYQVKDQIAYLPLPRRGIKRATRVEVGKGEIMNPAQCEDKPKETTLLERTQQQGIKLREFSLLVAQTVEDTVNRLLGPDVRDCPSSDVHASPDAQFTVGRIAQFQETISCALSRIERAVDRL